MSNPIAYFLNHCRSFGQTRLPQACLLCGARVSGALLCPGCVRDLPALPVERCPQCALSAAGGNTCGHCLKHPPAFRFTLAAHAYAFPLDALVKHCKYAGALALTDGFAASLAQAAAAHARPDLLLPMPLHESRLAERGFNQAAEIARRLSDRIQVPWLPAAARRLRNTPPQAGLDLDARRRNLRGAFVCDADLSGRHVALVDDVMTSGASLDELARAALKAGAREVSAWVVARTL